MNAAIVLSFHGSLEDKFVKWKSDKERISEFLLMRKFSESFERTFLFTHDSKDFSGEIPSNFRHVRLHSRIIYILFSWIVLLAYVKRNGIRVVYIECGPSLFSVFLVNRLSGAKVIMNYDNTLFLTAGNPAKRWVYRRLEFFLQRFVDYFIVGSTEIRNMVKDKSRILPVKKGIVLEKFDPRKVRASPLLGKIRGPKLIFVGRLHPVKDPITLMKAYRIAKRSVKDLHLIIAGDGELRGECERLADKDVHFLGFVREIPSLLKGSDIFVLSSVYDASPRSLMEAMAMGLPSIATNVGGIPDYLDETTGVIIEPGNPEMLAEKIVYLLRHRKLSKRMGERARDRMLKYHDLGKNLDWIIKFLGKELGK